MKFVSNEPEVLQGLPKERLAANVSDIDLVLEDIPDQKSLRGLFGTLGKTKSA